MKNLYFTGCVLITLLFVNCRNSTSQNGQTQNNPPAPASVTGKSVTHKNLMVWAIQGKDLVDREYITLEEAMDKSYIVLHETGNVGELSADNRSDKHIFIMAGDIVKGGKQDRTIGSDLVLEPGCKKVPLTSFCVEQSRWRQRGSENVAEFSSSKKMLSNKELKIAARSEKEQGRVWSEVSKFQEKAGENLSKDVKSQVSASSLQLTLEDKDLEAAVKEYRAAIQPLFDKKKDLLGFGFCINGKISTIETFGNAALFSKLQNKLLESAANEAVCLYNKELVFENPSEKFIRLFTDSVAQGKETITQTGKNTVEKKYQSVNGVLFKTFNTDAGTEPIHTSLYSLEGVDNSAKPTISINNTHRYGGHQRRN